ncbi:MAG: NAD-dependent protein deacylase [Dysgonamonadaceae bacterium]|jgi:NAD-dependent deacetylase|nr:NAD-dependent protein deacylase [Dysgonamonadaceae bacterium]
MTAAKKHLVVFSGAGISVESGIATFRGEGGLWDKYDVDEISSIEAWNNNKTFVLNFFNQRKREMLQAQPNKAHKIIAELEDHFKVSIITQNIDNLHEKAGSTNVLHLHGEITKACNEDKNHIIDIGDREIQVGDKAPDDSQLRPYVVWFGEQVIFLEEAMNLVESADILLIVGTSLNVQPAASLPELVGKDTSVFLIDPNPQNINRKITIIPTKANEGMEVIKAFLLEGKPLPTYELLQEEETDEMLLICNRMINEYPDNPDFWMQKATRLGELERYDEAVKCQDEAMKLFLSA